MVSQIHHSWLRTQSMPDPAHCHYFCPLVRRELRQSKYPVEMQPDLYITTDFKWRSIIDIDDLEFHVGYDMIAKNCIHK